MALDQNAQYPVGTIGPNANYPEGEAVNSSAPGALDGYPWEKEGVNDLLGFQQALLRAGGAAASGVADTALVSQYLQMIVELASGRAVNYDESGAANAYVLDVRANQQAPQALFDGLEFNFIPGNTNTGAATASPAGLGLLDIKISGGVSDPVAGQLFAGKPETLIYRTAPSAHLELKGAPFITPEQTITSGGLLTIAHGLNSAEPSATTARLVCKVAEFGYSIGDVIEVGHVDDTGVVRGAGYVIDAININIRFSSEANVFTYANFASGAGAALINANWKLIVRAWA